MMAATRIPQQLDPNLADCGFFSTASVADEPPSSQEIDDHGATSDDGAAGSSRAINPEVVDYPCRMCRHYVRVGHTPAHRELTLCKYCGSSQRPKGFAHKYFCANCKTWCKKDKFVRDHEAEQEDGLTRCTPGRVPDRKRKWSEQQTGLIIQRVTAKEWTDSDAEYEALWRDVVGASSSLTLEQLRRKVEYILLSAANSRSSSRPTKRARSQRRRRKRRDEDFDSSQEADDDDEDDDFHDANHGPTPKAASLSLNSRSRTPRAAAAAARTHLARAFGTVQRESPSSPLASSEESTPAPSPSPADDAERAKGSVFLNEPSRLDCHRPAALTLPPLHSTRGATPRASLQRNDTTGSEKLPLPISPSRVPHGLPQSSVASTATVCIPPSSGLSSAFAGPGTTSAPNLTASDGISPALMHGSGLWGVEVDPVGTLDELLAMRELSPIN